MTYAPWIPCPIRIVETNASPHCSRNDTGSCAASATACGVSRIDPTDVSVGPAALLVDPPYCCAVALKDGTRYRAPCNIFKSTTRFRPVVSNVTVLLNEALALPPPPSRALTLASAETDKAVMKDEASVTSIYLTVRLCPLSDTSSASTQMPGVLLPRNVSHPFLVGRQNVRDMT